MHENYRDITSRIAEPPKWYDANGAPRYDDFHPDFCPDIYSDEIILLRIACQACGRKFDVEIHSGLFEELRPKECHYGDPPAHGCVGDTMNCVDLEVLQVWYKHYPMDEWERHPELEGVIEGPGNENTGGCSRT